MPEMFVPFVDLKQQIRSLRSEIDRAIAEVIEGGHFILGPEVAAFESAFAAYCGVEYCVGVGNGTDAIACALRACGLLPDEEVILPANTYMATYEAVLAAGGVPVLVDCGEDGLIDPEGIEARITRRSRFLIAVHLHGQMCDMAALQEIADRHGLTLIEDAAQAHGATYRGRRAGAFGRAAAFSFYPSKNLGAFGDGGAVVTDDPEVARRLRMLRNHGESEKNVHAMIGTNSRLDTLQAAVLHVKLPHLDRWNALRRSHAAVYHQRLAEMACRLPIVHPEREHVYHLFTIEVEERDAFREFLEAEGIGTGIHYPTPIHRQPANRHLGIAAGVFPVAERQAARTVSLPLFPELTKAQIDAVTLAIARWFSK
ncbi:MAG: DegT/DnrJ/EryC1/StrS family aminotransferase [Deltaproteobacteria bacterium]|nr:MAG: DegT/DnrJ/EryC1/StrS family aminotransferase [Deltaproteobacteria bacterium]